MYLRGQLSAHKGFYAPTYFFLRELDRKIANGIMAQRERPYNPRKTPYKPPRGKGKQRELQDKEFEREFTWVNKMVLIEEEEGVRVTAQHGDDGDASQADDDGSDADNPDESDGEDEENGIECGCCFSKFRFVCIFL
jgi:TRIAD3 protein (E3 ubiquitin-protein ligase RNF216)